MGSTAPPRAPRKSRGTASPAAGRAWRAKPRVARHTGCTAPTSRLRAKPLAYMAPPPAPQELGRWAQPRRPAGPLMACTAAQRAQPALASTRSLRGAASGSTYGVYGSAASPTGIGVDAVSTGGGTALVATAQNGGNAGQFNGNVKVTRSEEHT